MSKEAYTRDDFTHKNEVRWCPGCGDYAILSALQRTLPELGLPPEQHVFVSGIGCAGRLPYYMNTYGFHTIHGRATAVATGLKALRDDLSVWVITGDGDSLSIGGNHLIHCLRRNVNMNILLINNQVYGLTKGQFSPTSQLGQVTKTSPQGVQHRPLNPLMLALASGASFVARAVDKDPQQLSEILKLAWAHNGCAFIEIYQECHVFNQGAFDGFALKSNRAKHTLVLRENEPLYFGDHQVLTQDGDHLTCVSADVDQNYRHDSHNFHGAMRLAELTFPEFPVPLGIYYQEKRDSFSLSGNINKTTADLPALFRSGASWQQK